MSPGEKTGENTETVPELERGTDSQLAFIDISQSTGVPEDAGCFANSSLAFNDLDECDSEPSTSQPSIHTFSYTTCCSSRCIASMNLLELEQVQSSFSSRSRSDQRQFLFDIVIASTKRTYDTFCVDSYVLSGKQLCRKAFLSVLGISCKRLRTVTRLVEAGAVNTKCTSIKIRKKTDKVEIACAWMESYFKRIGDRMPHVQQLHLPSFLSKLSVYQQMMDELAQQGHTAERMLSLSHFYALWNERFSYCVIPKVILALLF